MPQDTITRQQINMDLHMKRTDLTEVVRPEPTAEELERGRKAAKAFAYQALETTIAKDERGE